MYGGRRLRTEGVAAAQIWTLTRLAFDTDLTDSPGMAVSLRLWARRGGRDNSVREVSWQFCTEKVSCNVSLETVCALRNMVVAVQEAKKAKLATKFRS